MQNFWRWLSDPKNQATLKFIGGGVAAVVVAAWAVFTYLHKSEPPASSTQITVNEMHNGNVAGRDQYISTIEGLSEKRFQTLSEELGVTKAALKSFFKILKENQVPPEDLDSMLREIANRYKDLETQLQHFTSEDSDVATLKRQASATLQSGDFDSAEEVLNQAKEKDVQGAREFQDLAHKRLLSAAATASQTAELKNTQLAYAEAAEYYRQAAELVPIGEEKYLAKYLDRQGLALLKDGKYLAAETPLRCALEVREKALGPDHPDVATSLNSLALIYQAQGQYAQAEPLLKRSLAIREKSLGSDHPDVATSLNNLALLYQDQGRYDQAEPLYKKSQAIWEKSLCPDHPYVANNLNNLGGLYQAQGKYDEAEPLFKRSLEIKEKVLGSDHPEVAIILNNLAALYQAQGKYDQAEPLFKRSLVIGEKALGPDHPDVAAVLENIAALYHATDRENEALALERRAARIRAIKH